jgi:hypothetical protein
LAIKQAKKKLCKEGLAGAANKFDEVAMGGAPVGCRMVLNTSCRRCGHKPETRWHRYYGCPKLEEVGEGEEEENTAMKKRMGKTRWIPENAKSEYQSPAVFWFRGLIPYNLSYKLGERQESDATNPNIFDGIIVFKGGPINEGSLDLFTDGSGGPSKTKEGHDVQSFVKRAGIGAVVAQEGLFRPCSEGENNEQ